MKPTVDLAFHRLFSHHGNASVLLDFLNALLLSSGDRPATTVKVLSPILERRSADSKGGVLEIRASLEDGRRANVEMQVVNQRVWRARSLYYWAGIHGTQLKPSEPYEKTTPTISVGALSFRLWTGNAFHGTFLLRADHDRDLVWNDQLALHTVELPKLPPTAGSNDIALVRWMTFLMDGPVSLKEAVAMESPAVRQAFETLQELSYDQQLRMEYEAREKAQRDQISLGVPGQTRP